MLKTLADCKPSEFLRQTNRIRKSVSRWLTDTDILNIRRRKPAYETAPAGADAEEKADIIRRNAEAERRQITKNLNDMLEAMLEDHPDETLEIMALCCFVEPENVDDYPISDYIQAFTRLINDETVIGFFISLARLGRSAGQTAAKA